MRISDLSSECALPISGVEPRHIQACQAIWKAIEDAGHIYLGTYAGWYAVRDEAFYAESELTDGPDGKKDRKSVVSGQSVSVRVDLGGSRSIKKITETRTIHRDII